MKRPTVVAAGMLVAISTGGCGADATDPPATPGSSADLSQGAAEAAGRIVFRRFLDDSETTAALFTSDVDGNHETQLTDPGPGVVDDEPNWSPDGSRIVFSRDAGVGSDHETLGIYVIGADGTGLTSVSPTFPGMATDDFFPGADQGPAFSPDGKQIAFSHFGGHIATAGTHGLPEGFDQIEDSEIFVMNADGSHRRQVTHHPAYSGDSGTGVAWSPDGTELVYARFTSPAAHPSDCRSLFLVDVTGDHQRQLTPCSLGAGGSADWSADGVIVFRAVADEESGIGNFFRIDADGGGPTQITDFSGTVISHKVGFSPDGQHIVFAKETDGGANDVFTAGLDGSDMTAVTDNPLADSSPDWGPPTG